ncbi:MAG: LTA synthase family protein [Clostridia bacterium]|nr:LTA synthase family protein [Clostridia bacterium]
MEEPIVLKRVFSEFKNLKHKIDINAAAVFLLFFIFNTLKVSVFNLFITSSTLNTGSILYKLLLSFSITFLLYELLLLFSSRVLISVFFVLQTVYIFANLSYYLYFHYYLHLSQSSALFSEGLGAAGHFAIPKNLKLLILLVDLPFFIFFLLLYKRILELKRKLHIIRKFIALICLSAILITESWNYVHNYSLAHFIKDYSSYETLIVERYGTVVNNAVDSWVNRNDQKLINSLAYGKTISAKPSAAQKPNFVIIQVESMDSNIIRKQYNGKYIMPFLNSISEECIYYPYTLSYHKAGGTSDCEFSTMNSIEPLDNFPSMKISSYTYPNSFIKILSANSYHTAVFHGNTASYFSRDKAYVKMGFKEFHDMQKMGLGNVGWGAPDKDVFAYTLGQMKKQISPFLYYVITMTSHGPYTNANYYYDNNNYDGINNVVVRDYFNSMSYVDQTLNFFVDFIRENLKNTYIVILGDHTPGIYNDIFRQASFYLDGKYFELVPVMIITPEGEIRKEESISASFLDIAPTILSKSGVSFQYKTNGINLFSYKSAGSIPYKGSDYDRKLIYEKVSPVN